MVIPYWHPQNGRIAGVGLAEHRRIAANKLRKRDSMNAGNLVWVEMRLKRAATPNHYRCHDVAGTGNKVIERSYNSASLIPTAPDPRLHPNDLFMHFPKSGTTADSSDHDVGFHQRRDARPAAPIDLDDCAVSTIAESKLTQVAKTTALAGEYPIDQHPALPRLLVRRNRTFRYERIATRSSAGGRRFWPRIFADSP